MIFHYCNTMILKNNIHYKIISLVVLLLLSANSYTQDIQYGLKFKSYEVEKEKRTSLYLTPEKPLSLPSVYTFSFDLKFHSSGRDPFGYIFRIFDEEGHNISMLINILRNTTTKNLVFTYSSKEILSKTFDDLGLIFDEWYKVEVNIDTKKALFTVTIGERKFTQNLPEIKTFNKINVVFGRNDRFGLQITDIPSMTIKDIRIFNDDKSKILYEWLLKNYNEAGSYDEIKHELAVVANPDWLLNQHVFWKKKYSLLTENHSQIAYNPINSEVGVYNNSTFKFFGIASDKETVDTILKLNPWGPISNNLLYDKNSGQYIYYTFEFEREADVLFYDTVMKSWDMTAVRNVPPDYWHHNRIISAHDGKLYLFGGYGYHKYKNDVHIYDFEKKEWTRSRLKGDGQSPHYLSGLGVLDDKHVLIFGGYGSETGEQSLAPRYFYDLYKVNMETLESEKLWTLDNPEKDFVISNSIVVDTASRSFYALAYSLRQFHTTLTLLRFSMDKPEYEILGDSIPIRFEDNKSFVDLFLEKSSERLVAVISGPTTLHSIEDEVSIYTLAYPPLAISDLYRKAPSSFIQGKLLMASLIIVLLLSAALFYYFKKKKKEDIMPESEHVEDDNKNVYIRKKTDEVMHPRSVLLFGGFCVVDKNSNDATKDFTPMLKQLFVLILLYTYKDRKGISSTKLKDVLWFDKSDESAKNNRGVSLNKLRQIFENLGNISIISNNAYWTVEFGEDVSCDYPEALSLIDSLSRCGDPDLDNLRKLLSLLSRGELLPDLQVEWVDSFKSDFSNNLMDVLFELSKKQKIRENPQLCIDLADVIFIQDSLNEDALRLKCVMLIKMGRNKLSKNVYESFVKEYRILFASDFEITFEQIINN